MKDHDIQDCRLGESDMEITLQTSDENLQVTTQMLGDCRRHLDIISRDLDPKIYATGGVIDDIKKLAIRSRFSRIRIIVLKPQSLVSRGHRLINLSEQLSSFIEIRKPGKAHKDFNQALLLVDSCGYIRRPHSDRFEGIANFNDQKTVAELTHEFESLWEHALPDSNFRRLSI